MTGGGTSDKAAGMSEPRALKRSQVDYLYKDPNRFRTPISRRQLDLKDYMFLRLAEVATGNPGRYVSSSMCRFDGH